MSIEFDLAACLNACLDDYPLTVWASTVYLHLLCRTGRDNEVRWSYVSIGERCFRATWPDAAKDTLRTRAIQAVKELEAKSLIKVLRRKSETGKSEINAYVIQHPSQWLPPDEAAAWQGPTIKRGRKGSANAPGSAIAPPPYLERSPHR